MRNYNFPQIAASWIVKNNKQGVIALLTQKGLIANTSIAASMDSEMLASVLYMYYLKNGAVAYANLLRQIPVNDNLSATENAQLDSASADIRNVLNISPVNNVTGGITTQDFKSSAKTFWDLIVGGSETTVSPVVTTTTKTSPLTIGLIIGGIAILAIIAYVITK